MTQQPTLKHIAYRGRRYRVVNGEVLQWRTKTDSYEMAWLPPSRGAGVGAHDSSDSGGEMQWEERLVRPTDECLDTLSVPYFDMILKSVAYSMVYIDYDRTEYTFDADEGDYRYLWCKITKSMPYVSLGGHWMVRQFHDLPKYVRDRFDEIKPVFKLLR